MGINQGTTNGDWLVCEQTRALLSRLDPALQEAARSDVSCLEQVSLHLINRGGKRLRPALVFLSATFGVAEEDRLLSAAAALELIHVASLLHDDIMDRAPLRRGVASVNAQWGNNVASAAGTFLFARACSLLASLGDLPSRLASQAAVELSTGQLKEVENAYNLELEETEHLATLALKTATLFELPCRLGAYLSGASQAHIEALAAYGRDLGLAFQLADDALDIMGDAGSLGKATGTDLRSGIYSLLVLRVLRNGGHPAEELREILSLAQISEIELERAVLLLRESGMGGEVLTVAREYASRAQAALGVLPAGAARHSLSRLALHAITRAS